MLPGLHLYRFRHAHLQRYARRKRLTAGSITVTVTADDGNGGNVTDDIHYRHQSPEPVAVGTIAAVTLTLGESPETIDVASNFNDPESGVLTYTVSSNALDVAIAGVSGSIVTVTAVGAGSVTITVTARDPAGLSATQSIEVTVRRRPTAIGTIAAVTLTVGDSAVTRDVATNFNDPESGVLTYTVSSDTPSVATVGVSGSIVTVTAVGAGSATITVTAGNPFGLSATQSIAVTVAANQAPTAVGTIVAVTLTVGDSAVTRDVATNFNDPESGVLTYTVSSDTPSVATVGVSGSVVTVTPVGAGSATITVTAHDSVGLIATQDIAVTVLAPGVDLIVSAISVNDDTLTTGDSFTLRATVRNQGTDESSTTTLRYYLSTDSTISTADSEVATDSVSAIAPSATSAESTSLTAPSTPGTSYYGACVDSVSNESGTTNNCSAAVMVTVTAPDLIVSEVSSSVFVSITLGESFTLSATVHNQGNIESSQTTLRYYRSTDSTISTTDSEIATDSVSAIAPSATSAESTSLTEPNTGFYYYGACVDSVSNESDTTNNCSTNNESVSILGSDLMISFISVNDDTLTPTAAFILRATVRNIDFVLSSQTTLRYYRSSDSIISTTDTQVGTDAVSTLRFFSTSAESISLTAPSSPGTYYYGACVDFVSFESERSNNCSTGVPVTVERQ